MRSDEVKNQDLISFFVSLAANREAKRQLWDFFKTNFDEIMARFRGNFSSGSLVRMSFSTFASEGDAKDVEQFFKGKDTSAFSQPLSQGLDAVRSKAKWLERDTSDVSDWLKKNQYL